MTKTPKARDISHTVYEQVRDAIHSGEFKVGERVTEVALAEKFGVSRTPIREAISKLEIDGLLTNVPRRGLIITDLSHQQIGELYMMREVLEGAAARLAALSGSDVEITALKDLVAMEAGALDDPQQLSEINKRFHRLLALAAHNRYLLVALEQLSVTMSLLPSLLGEGARARSAHDQHIQIVEALRTRDPDAAEQAIRQHIRASHQHRLMLAAT
ncbi:GntR family transcriptional regulator [Cereibacter sphaeroides]|uniref:GntR family transcriptional regulator n=1 Tax=Cereibacter sphaeroides TaxID=1063 RepID=UPI000F5292B1|nr:GntR family transcriptional regulator [Cereibacter sphaeroides]AZB65424.1 GntR family transcriptional regulator [Cereibacter sphaeroides]AZB70121.1 GntR family transcriptional regulator [Cereibacter sphaeroides]